jgi:hypothetical protein
MTWCPNARVAVLVDPANASNAKVTLRGVPEAAPSLGLQIQVVNVVAIDTSVVDTAPNGQRKYSDQISTDFLKCAQALLENNK